jgi:hypothetical protein
MFDIAKLEKESIACVNEQYLPMIEKIEEYRPVLLKDTSNFNKTQSQFMDNIVTIMHPTPLRNIRQALAEINKSQMALNESYFKVEKLKVEIKKLERQLQTEEDELEIEMIKLDIQEKQSNIFYITQNQEGAIRKITNYVEQIKSIKQSHNIESFDELDFEKEEDVICMKEIEDGKYELFTCIKSYYESQFSLEEGTRYYVKVEDSKSILGEMWSEVGTDEIKKIINIFKFKVCHING